MANNHCVLSVEVISRTEDGTIRVTKGESEGNINITMTNTDKESSSMVMTKKELNDIIELVNKNL